MGPGNPERAVAPDLQGLLLRLRTSDLHTHLLAESNRARYIRSTLADLKVRAAGLLTDIIGYQAADGTPDSVKKGIAAARGSLTGGPFKEAAEPSAKTPSCLRRRPLAAFKAPGASPLPAYAPRRAHGRVTRSEPILYRPAPGGSRPSKHPIGCANDESRVLASSRLTGVYCMSISERRRLDPFRWRPAARNRATMMPACTPRPASLRSTGSQANHPCEPVKDRSTEMSWAAARIRQPGEQR